MRALAFLSLTACASKDDAPGTGDSSTHDSATDDSAIEKSCTLVGAIDLPSTDVTLPVAALDASITDAGSGRTYAVAWTASHGNVTPGAGLAVSWDLGESLALHGPEDAALTATATAEGCEPQIVRAVLRTDWPDSERTIVIYNPNLVESRDVALYYAAFRGIPDDKGLCAIATSATSTLPAADFAAWMRAEQACLDLLAGRARYVVPVYGVPFEVAGVVKDLFYETYVTTSLDAQMAFGDAALALLEANDDYPIYNPAYLPGESDTQSYTPYEPYPQLWTRLAEADVFEDAQVVPQFYMVARIDGSYAGALDLVDRTALAEKLAKAGALDGIVYVDGRYGNEPPATDYTGSYEAGEWNMWGTRYVFEDLGWYDVVWDGNNEELGTAPAPTKCPEALYFAGWYSYDHYNGCFEWAAGAIGGHLDSASAGDVRGGTNWTHQALEAGITATFGAVEEPYVAGMPEYDQFFLALTSGATFGEAAYESTLIAQWMMVWVGDPLYRPYPE